MAADAELVARAADRLDEIGSPPCVSELPAKAGDVDVHPAVDPVVGDAAQARVQLVARDRLPGARRQVPEEVGFGSGQRKAVLPMVATRIARSTTRAPS